MAAAALALTAASARAGLPASVEEIVLALLEGREDEVEDINGDGRIDIADVLRALVLDAMGPAQARLTAPLPLVEGMSTPIYVDLVQVGTGRLINPNTPGSPFTEQVAVTVEVSGDAELSFSGPIGSDLPVGFFTVANPTAPPPGSATFTATSDVASPAEPLTLPVGILSEVGGELLLDSGGGPVPAPGVFDFFNTRVELLDDAGERGSTYRFGIADGRFRFVDLDPGPLMLGADYRDGDGVRWVSDCIAVSVTEEEVIDDLDLILRPVTETGAVRGTVTPAFSSPEITSVSVALVRADGTLCPPLTLTTLVTPETLEYFIREVPPGDHFVRASSFVSTPPGVPSRVFDSGFDGFPVTVVAGETAVADPPLFERPIFEPVAPLDYARVSGPLTLTWEEPPGAASHTYTVTIEERPGGPELEIGGLTEPTVTITDPGLPRDRWYFWNVVAEPTGGGSRPRFSPLSSERPSFIYE